MNVGCCALDVWRSSSARARAHLACHAYLDVTIHAAVYYSGAFLYRHHTTVCRRHVCARAICAHLTTSVLSLCGTTPFFQSPFIFYPLCLYTNNACPISSIVYYYTCIYLPTYYIRRTCFISPPSLPVSVLASTCHSLGLACLVFGHGWLSSLHCFLPFSFPPAPPPMATWVSPACHGFLGAVLLCWDGTLLACWAHLLPPLSLSTARSVIIHGNSV